MTLRWYWSPRGTHVHVRVFAVPDEGSTGMLAGLLIFNTSEWIQIRDTLPGEVLEDEPGTIYPDRGGRL